VKSDVNSYCLLNKQGQEEQWLQTFTKKKIVHKSSVCKSLNSYLYNFKATDVIYSFFTNKKRSAGFYAENYISRRKFTFYMDFNCKAYE
jgi:hypothetical protein